MNTHDRNNRPYAKMSELRAGDKIELDNWFTCMGNKSAIRKVKQAKDGSLYFDCNQGAHLLIGQAHDGEHCVGVYKV